MQASCHAPLLESIFSGLMRLKFLLFDDIELDVMEAAICLNPLFDQALVVGEGKPSLGAVLVLNSDLWFGFAKELGLDPFERESLDNEHLHRKVLSRLREQLHEFPGYAKIRHVILTLDPWTMEDDLVTPTLKVKRAKVQARFAERIEALYEQ